MGWAGPQLCGRRASDQRAAAECRCGAFCSATCWLSPVVRAMGSDHADRWAELACVTPRRRRRSLPGRNIHSDSAPRHPGLFGEKITHYASAKRVVDLAAGLSGDLGGGLHLRDLPFALIKIYSPSKLSSFTFITPLFSGVVAAYFIMHDPLTVAFGAAGRLVIAGLYLCGNKPDPFVPAASQLACVMLPSNSRLSQKKKKKKKKKKKRKKTPSRNPPLPPYSPHLIGSAWTFAHSPTELS